MSANFRTSRGGNTLGESKAPTAKAALNCTAPSFAWLQGAPGPNWARPCARLRAAQQADRNAPEPKRALRASLRRPGPSHPTGGRAGPGAAGSGDLTPPRKGALSSAPAQIQVRSSHRLGAAVAVRLRAGLDRADAGVQTRADAGVQTRGPPSSPVGPCRPLVTARHRGPRRCSLRPSRRAG